MKIIQVYGYNLFFLPTLFKDLNSKFFIVNIKYVIFIVSWRIWTYGFLSTFFSD